MKVASLSSSRNSQFCEIVPEGTFILLGFEEEDCAMAEVEIDEMFGF